MGEKFLILGWDRKKGEYQGKAYDNYVFYVEPEARKATAGIIAEQIKVKVAVVDLCGVKVDESVIGKELVTAYNRFGQVSAIEVCDL